MSRGPGKSHSTKPLTKKPMRAVFLLIIAGFGLSELSGPIRTKIGTAKKHLSRQLQSARQLFADYELDIDQPAFDSIDDDSLDDLHTDVTATRKSVLSAFNTVSDLHNAWETIMINDPSEVTIHSDYVKKYGDYRLIVSESITVLEHMDSALTVIDSEFARRLLPPPRTPSPDSDRDADDAHNDAFVEAIHQPTENPPRQQVSVLRATRQQELPANLRPKSGYRTQPVTLQAAAPPANHGTPTFNFVDASILSKLQLPTFEGDLLEFPEFWARYSTLVGDKLELDDATKFSLLKSCLRGKALMSIQGLSITSANYTIAVDILKTHYDDQTTTRHIIFTKLFNLPACDPEGKNLLSIYNQMFALIRQYSAYAGDSREYALGVALLNKLPRNIRSKIYDRTKQQNVTPTELLTMLTDIVRKETTLQAMEQQQRSLSSFPATITNVRTNPNNQHPQKNSPRHPPHPRSERRTARCQLCESDDHNVFNCDVHVSGKDRCNAAKEKKLCLNCLYNKHTTKDCSSIKNCGNCQRRHHTALCFGPRQSEAMPQASAQPARTTTAPPQQKHRSPTEHKPSPKSSQGYRRRPDQAHFVQENDQQYTTVPYDDDESYSGPPSVQVLAAVEPAQNDDRQQPPADINGQRRDPQVILMCTTVTLFNPDQPERSIRTTAFLDSGSSKSYITREIAISLGLPFGTQDDLNVNTFGSLTTKHLTAYLHSVGLLTVHGEARTLAVKSVDTVTSSLKVLHLDQETQEITMNSSTPGILIGSDYFWDLILSPDFYASVLPSGHRLLFTHLGHIVTGPSFNHEHTYSSEIQSSSDLQNPGHHKKLEKLVERFWNYESLGIVDHPTESDDDRCLQDFNNHIYLDRDEGRYIVKLPFKVDPKELPSNYNLAYSRLAANVKNLSRNEEYMKKYHEIIMDQLRRGIIEEVRYPNTSEACHYLAHHGVITEAKKTTKIRCVYDGSAKVKGHISLNEALYRGPVLLPDITGILLRVRAAPILISSDIEKAFLMVGLHPESRPFTRFLWLRDPSKGMVPDNVITYVFRRVPFGLIVSPFLLAGTIHFHMASTGSRLSECILRNCYVDNVFNSVNTTQEGKRVYEESKSLFAQAGMNLREFVSSDSDLNTYLVTKESASIDVHSKILGINWTTTTDMISINLPLPNTDVTTWTKRKVLKQVASIYDPLGWAAPVTLVGKIFLQSLWKEEMDWDQPLNEELLNAWMNIMSSWTIRTLQMPRRFTQHSTSASTFSLHIFTDASKDAYCAVAYLVEQHPDRAPSINLLMSKTRLAPNKLPSVTIPRLELSGITIGSSLLKHIEKELDIPIQDTVIWSDSRVALMWIKIEKDLPVFVRNRVKTIKTNAPHAVLRHVPGELNPADIGSRGSTIEELMNYSSWWTGPEFLTLPSEKWPVDKSHLPPHENDDLPVAMLAKEPDLPLEDPIVDCNRFSSWIRLLNTVVTVLMFISKSTAHRLFKLTKPQLLESAQQLLFKQAQQEYPPSEAVRKQLQLFTCPTTQLLRCRGRIENADLPPDTISPIFLPRESPITELFVLAAHLRLLHCGTEHLIIELRKTVWIPRSRATVKKIIHNQCYYCKRLKAKPYSLPDFPVHPTQRVLRPKYPFESCGMDYFGPMFYRSSNQTVEKYWILLLTCLNSRAIYVDIVTDMTTRSLLHLLRQFFAQNGYPRWIICDNAKGFHTIDDLQTALQPRDADPDIMDYCAHHKITFKFIPSHSPWQGGLFERMVGVYKVAYKHAVNRRILPMEILRTLCKEAEAICNSRPLTHVTDDIDYFPLRPIDFLRPTAPLAPPRFNDENEEDEWKPQQKSTRDEVLTDWKQTTKLLNRFWTRWSTEYLTSLREKYQMSHPHPRLVTTDKPCRGDVVLVHDDNIDRGQWKMGQLCGSTDNFIRSAQIRLPSGNIITRPINLISKFEIPHEPLEENIPPKEEAPIRHPMLTRSRTTPLLATIILIAAILQPVHALESTRCPDELTTPKTIIYATNCASKGVAIARYSQGDKTQMCWFPLNCPMGAIHVSVPMKLNEGFCGVECKCPTWSTSCSHSRSLRRATSTIEHLPTNMSTYRPLEVCSFEKSEYCSATTKLGIFNQIELFDGNKIIVPQLHVTINEFVDAQDFICFDRSGQQVEARQPYSGTSFFCEKNNCQDIYETFCTFDNPVALFDAYTDTTTPLLIRAWGTTPKQYYDSLPIANTPLQEIQEPQCTRGGITIYTNNTLDMIEACIRSYCVFLTNYSTPSPVLFPSELVVFNYKVEIQIWKDGRTIYKKATSCKAHPLCDAIDCTLCLEKIYNPQCWTTMELVKALMSSFLFCIVYYTIIPLLRILIWLASLLCRPCLIIQRRIRQRCRPRHQPQPLPRYTRNRRMPRSPRVATLLMIVAVFLLFRSTKACSEVISITASEHTCLSNTANETTCKFNQATTITLQPLGQETCLALRNDNEEPVGTISLKISSIQYKCNKRIDFFTRDHEFVSESSHRCYRAGSCQPGRCDNTKINDKLEEISWKAKNSPGFTFCASSCQCVSCNGCFFCDPSCLFYRYYAAPTSQTIYTVQSCPSWELTVNVDIAITEHSTRQTHSLTLQPGKTTRWNSIKTSLLSATSPQLPILSTTFITNDKTTSATSNVAAGQLIAHTVGQLQCRTRQDATNFNCVFPSNVCTCSTGGYKSSCSCTSGDVSQFLNSQRLPLMMKNIMISEDKNEIYAHTQIGAAVQVHLVVEDLQITTITDLVNCSITTSTLTGCYSCALGAQTTIACQSERETTADITCGTQHQIAVCNQRGHVSTIQFNYDTAKIDQLCHVRCPGGRSTFQLTGDLEYVNNAPFLLENTIDDQTKLSKSFNIMSSLYDLANDILPGLFYVKYFAIFILIASIIVIMVYIVFKVRVFRSLTAQIKTK